MTIAIQHRELATLLTDILESAGADRQQASIACEALVWSDLVGRDTHGTWRFPAYLKRFQRGLIRCPCFPEVSTSGAATIRIRGDQGFGHYLGHLAMEHAIAQAEESGASVVSVYESNHFGAAGYFACQAANKGMLGLALSNSVAKVAATGGVSPLFGTNPIAFAAPRKDARPVLLDLATAAMSGGAILRAKETGAPLPEGVLVGGDGAFITDSAQADQGVMLPFGGAKGGGLALLVEILCGVISGGRLSTEVRSMFGDFSGNGDNTHCFIAIDIRRFIAPEDYYQRLEHLVTLIKASAANATDDVRLPGEERWRVMGTRLVEGIPIDPTLADALRRLAAEASVALPDSLADRGA